MGFFKKNKTTVDETVDKEAAKPSPEQIEQDIVDMDNSRNLDQQIEDLTSKLNISPLNDLPTKPAHPTENIMHTAQTLGAIGSINQGLDKFVEPTFKTEPVKTKHSKTEDRPTQGTQNNVDADVDLSAFQVDAPNADPKRLNMAEMRMDVARISSDIQGGEELYRRALQRVEGLMGQVEKAEVDFSVLNRLEPENRRLKARLRTAQSELEGNKSKLGLLNADLEDHQERLDEKTIQYEQTRVKLVSATKTLHEYDRALKQSKTDVERHTLALERNKTALSVEGRENKVLREKMLELSEAVDARQSEFLEASKIAESLRVDCDEFRKQAEAYRSEAQDLRITLNTAKRQNNAMKGEMLALHDDIKTFKTQYEFNVIGREDQVTDLEVKLATVSKELDVKKDVADKREGELSQIRRVRAQQDIERERLEKALDAAKAELVDVSRLQASENSQQVTLLKKDIRDLQADLRRRDELAEDVYNETEALRRQLTSADIEREKLQTKLEISAAAVSPVSDLEDQIHKLTQKLKIKDKTVDNREGELSQIRRIRAQQDIERERLETALDTAKAELVDANRLQASENSEEVALLQKDIRDLQADLRRRDELAENIHNETEALRQQLTTADIERENLQAKLDIQIKEQTSAAAVSPVSDLEDQVQKLTQQLKVKDETVRNAVLDVTTLRKDRETYELENKRLKDLINDQTYQLESAQKSLLESKQSETELDKRYKDVAAALSANNTRRQSEVWSPTQDIDDETPALNEDEIESRILDYKFGISNKII